MSHGLVSGSLTSFHNCSKSNLSAALKPSLEPCSHLSIGDYNTHFPKPGLSLKRRSGSCRTRPRAIVYSLQAATTTTESFYDLLGISESGTLSEIKQAYKKLARKYHPDVSPPERIEEHTKRFIQLREAYETLSDPTTRALYDGGVAAMGLDIACSFGKRSRHKQGFDGRSEWKTRWESQLAELKGRSMDKDLRGKKNMSWGATIGRQRCKQAEM